MLIKREAEVIIKKPENDFLLPEEFEKIKKISQSSLKKLLEGRKTIIDAFGTIKK